MAKLQGVQNEPDIFLFYCPGCESPHQIRAGSHNKPGWSFNGDRERPTFNPSLLVFWDEGEPPVDKRCHSFIRDGMIQFLGDCTHVLKGQTVEIPDWDTAMGKA